MNDLCTIASSAVVAVMDSPADDPARDVVTIGGRLGVLLARTSDDGTHAWTIEQACQHVGVDVDLGIAAYALWQGCYTAWARRAGELRLAELAASQLELST